MLTAKLVVSRALPFDLPAAASGDDVQEIFSLSLTAAGETVLDGQTLPNSPALLRRAKSALAANPQLRAVLRADGRVPHARVLHCMDVLRQAGITRIAFAVAPGAEVDEVEDQPAGAEPPGYVWPKRE
jgi:biopolymer transport protein ExbD